jgi:hypothetical protein
LPTLRNSKVRRPPLDPLIPGPRLAEHDHRRLKASAALHGVSMERRLSQILAEALRDIPLPQEAVAS